MSQFVFSPELMGFINPEDLFEEIDHDRELLHCLIDTACHDLPAYFAKLEMEATQQDARNAGLTAHAMKTTLAHWQAETPRALAQSIEGHCKAGRSEEGLALIPSLGAALQPVLSALGELKEMA
jgi:HPt (histidine-containing phosphotransfer) domain-containing protein